MWERPAEPQGQTAPPPEPSRAPARPFWVPGFDPHRQTEGPGWNIPAWLLDVSGARPADTTIQAGDILPNLRDIWGPTVRGAAAEEAGGLLSTPQARQQVRETLGFVPSSTPLVGLPQTLGWNLQHPFKAAGLLGDLVTRYVPTLVPDVRVTAPVVGELSAREGAEAALSVPGALLQTASLPGQLTEQTFGAASQATGLPIASSLATFASGGALLPLLARAAAGGLRAVGMEDEAQQVEQSGATDLAPSAWGEWVANGLARARAAGRDAPVLEGLLPLLTPLLTEPEREQLIQQQAALVRGAATYGQEAYPAWYASQYSYEDMDRVLEVRDRLARGETWEQIIPDVEERITFQGRYRNIMGQAVYDPINLLDFVPLGPIGGGLGRRARNFTQADVGRMLARADDGMGVATFARYGDIDVPRGFLGRFVQTVNPRLPSTVAARVGEETGNVVRNLLDGIAEDAAVRLSRQGIRHHPETLAMAAFLDHHGADILGTGKSADEIQTLLGLDAFPISPTQARDWGLTPGTLLDPLRNQAADRARTVLGALTDATRGNVMDDLREGQRMMREVLETGRTTVRQGEKIVEVGRDAANAQVMKALTRIEQVAAESLGMAQPTGLLGGLQRAADKAGQAQGFIARFFQLGPNPGYGFRNIESGTVGAALFDGVDVLTPLRRQRDEAARLGLGGDIGMSRGLGAGVDALVQKFTAFEVGTRLTRWGENAMRDIAYLSGFKRLVRGEWQVGRMIPSDLWARADLLGEHAGRLRALTLNVRTADDLAAAKAAMRGEPWRLIDDPDLAAALDDWEVGPDIRRLLDESPTVEEFAVRAADYVETLNTHVEDLARRLPPARGTPEGSIAEDYAAALQGLPAKVRSGAYDEFIQRQAAWRVTLARMDAYVHTSIKRLRSSAQKDGLWNEYVTAIRDAQRRYDQLWNVDRDTVLMLIREQRFEELGQQYHLFENTTTQAQAWDLYRMWIDDAWRTARAEEIERLKDLGRRAGGGIPPDAALIEASAPATAAQRAQLFGALQQAWQASGAEGGLPHLRRFLNQQGLTDSDWLLPSDVLTRQWYNKALDAIHAREAGKLEDIAEAAPLADDVIDAMQDSPMPRADTDPSLDLVNRAAAQAAAADPLLQQVIEGALAKGKAAPPTYTPEQLAFLDEWFDTLKPRQASTYALAKELATDWADFAHINYGDRRQMDLVFSILFNYPMWHGRNNLNMLRRLMDSPGRVIAMLKLRQKIRESNADKPEWWQDQIMIHLFGQEVYLPLLANLDWMNGFFGDRFIDPDLNHTVYGQWLAETQRYGPGLNIWLSGAMALDALRRGEQEESLGWLGYLGSSSKGLNALSVLARSAGADFIPPGGVVLEPWLWRMEDGEVQAFQGGDKWENRRIGLALADMTTRDVDGQGMISQEQMDDAMLNQSGPIFERAVQASKQQTAGRILASWFLGAGIKPRPEIEIQVQQMDADVSALRARQGELSPEAYRQAWADLRERYPFMDAVRGFRRDDWERQDIYAWSIYNRLPPHFKPYFEAIGVRDADEYGALMDKFYQSKGIINTLAVERPDQYRVGQWVTIDGQRWRVLDTNPRAGLIRVTAFEDLEIERLMNVFKQFGAILALPDAATADQWEMARAARRGMMQALDREFEGASELESLYFTLPTQAERSRFLEAHSILQSYWDRRDQWVTGDPLLAQYYASMDTFVNVARDEFEAQQERLRPGLHTQLDTYYNLKETNPEAARDFLDNHPDLKAYWDAKDAWTLQLDTQLRGMTAGIEALEPAWAALRRDMDITTTGQQKVADLIQSGARPLGDFELPEDLPASELKAALNQQLDLIDAAGEAGWDYVRDQLRDMGLANLFSAYLTWSDKETVQGHEVELRALLAALASLTEAGLPAAYQRGGGGGRRQRESSGGGRSGRRPRIRSARHGGASTTPQTEPQQVQQEMQMQTLVGNIQQSAPAIYQWFRLLAGTTSPAEFLALLNNPRYASYMTELKKQWGETQFYTLLAQIVAYLKAEGQTAAQPPHRRRSRRAGLNRYSLPQGA